MSEISAKSRILLVDDDLSALFIYKTHLTRAGYQVLTATNATVARQLLSAEGAGAFAAVVTDFWMPGGSGLDILRQARSLDRTLSVVLMTAEGEKEHVAESLREGAQNFLDKPISGNILRDAVARAVEQTRRQRELRTTAEEARAMGDSQRLMLGRQTQALKGRLRLYSRPHTQAGGDFAAAFDVAEDRYVVLVSDVSGHDLKAAFYSAYLQGVARGMLDRNAPIGEVFKHLNALLLEDWNKGGEVELSLAICAVEMDLAAGKLKALNAGLPTPILADPDGWAVPLGDAKANPLGWFEDLPEEIECPLVGGRLYYWSDGLEDAAAKLDVFPLALAHRVLEEPSSVETLLAKAAKDDVVVVEIDLASLEGKEITQGLPIFAEVFSGCSETQIDSLQQRCENSLRMAVPELSEIRLGDALLSLRESLINALKHGCKGKPDHSALLQASLDRRRRLLSFIVSDDGDGHLFDHFQHEVEAATQMLVEHRGLILVKNLASRHHLSARGNRLSMDFPLDPP